MSSTDERFVRLGRRILFESAGIEVAPGRCDGVIGANQAGTSTLLGCLAGEPSRPPARS